MPERLALHKKWPDLTAGERTAVLDYLVNTCLVYGATTGTAYTVAGLFSDGLDRDCGAVDLGARDSGS
jgi:hypothetical protein